jgi:outer membrane scaffolding protein for murein synthesis (MipA/OmpV family)
MKDMRAYLVALITEKGRDINDEIQGLTNDVFGDVVGVEYETLIDFVVDMPQLHKQIRDTLVMIDFKNGDVFHYLDFLANGMVNN